MAERAAARSLLQWRLPRSAGSQRVLAVRGAVRVVTAGGESEAGVDYRRGGIGLEYHKCGVSA